MIDLWHRWRVSEVKKSDDQAAEQPAFSTNADEAAQLEKPKRDHRQFYEGMLALRGKVKLEIDIDASREDREFDERGNVIN